MKLLEQIAAYVPSCEQEEADRRLILVDGSGFEEVLGGLRMRPNGKVLNERTALTSEDIAICRRLLERKITITVRHSPEVAESLLTESVLKQL